MKTPPQSIEPTSEQSSIPGEPTVTQSPLSQNHSSDTLGAFTSPDGAPLAAPLEFIGPFSIVRILGEGGMGTVYLAEDSRLKRKAAIKTMKRELAAKPENRERFLREAQAAAAIEHDNVVPIWQVGESADGSPFIAMPFLQGEMLESRLKREPIQPLGMILKVAREVAEGLAAAHARGLIHRDIKPSNIWIDGDPESRDLAQQVRRCKILDFGLARCAEVADTHLTASGMILGTPAYMAPEQAGGEQVGHRADLFSLGVMLYRMSTGKLPFEGPNVMAVLSALATVTPPSARSRNPILPQALSDLIDRLMSKDPAGRPQSAAEVASAVRRIAKDLQAKNSAPPLATAVVPAVSAPVANSWEDITAAEPARTPKATLAEKARRNRVPLMIGIALLVLVPLGLWLLSVIVRVETDKGTLIVEISDPETEARVKNGKLILYGPDDEVRYTLGPSERNKTLEAGPYKIRVEGADGLTLDTPEFTLKKGGKVTVRVTMLPPVVVKGLDPDRKAAEFVLSIGGAVQVNGQEHEQRITVPANLPPKALLLTGINFGGTKVRDADMAYFKDCKNLMALGLGGTQLSNVGLANLVDCKKLLYLNLKACAKVDDTGLAHSKDCKNLMYLDLDGTQVSDAGLAHFEVCKNLRHLDLSRTAVSDAGIARFEDCKNLTYLNLQKTKVTAAKIEALKKALPKCKIEWDGDTEPKAK